MSNTASRAAGSDVIKEVDFAAGKAAARRSGTTTYRSRDEDVLPRDDFLAQLYREKRRSDRSRAPLSLVVMRTEGSGEIDANDRLDILSRLGISVRETDIIGSLGDGTVAFLLPYTDAQAANVFSRLIVKRAEVPAVNVHSATYPDSVFDTLLVDLLSQIKSNQVSALDLPSRKIVSLSVKRALDIVGSIILLILASPLMVITAIAVKLSSPGPAIFRQSRLGRKGQIFPFYKFRSMRFDSDDTIHREYVKNLIEGRHDKVNEGDVNNPVYKLQSDPRITAVGRFIRRASIDELPQLFNVLKGEMSLVGPRPPLLYETENYLSWHMRRLQEVRPGITGLWQVEGRSKTTFDEMVRLDLRYVRNWSLWLDFKIILKTILVVIRGDGAD